MFLISIYFFKLRLHKYKDIQIIEETSLRLLKILTPTIIFNQLQRSECFWPTPVCIVKTKAFRKWPVPKKLLIIHTRCLVGSDELCNISESDSVVWKINVPLGPLEKVLDQSDSAHIYSGIKSCLVEHTFGTTCFVLRRTADPWSHIYSSYEIIFFSTPRTKNTRHPRVIFSLHPNTLWCVLLRCVVLLIRDIVCFLLDIRSLAYKVLRVVWYNKCTDFQTLFV